MNGEELVRTCGPMVATLCRRMLKNRDLAADAEQCIWEKVLRNKDSFRGDSLISTWIYSIARNEILRQLKNENKWDYLELIEDYHAGVFEPAGQLPLRDQAAGFCDACLTGVLTVLEVSDRLIFIFRIAVGLSHGEIAEIMDLSEPAVRQRALRALRKIRRFLTEECALFKPGSTCRCGMAHRMKDAGLAVEFHRLKRVYSTAAVFRDAERIFPHSDYWMKMLKNAETLSQN